MRDLAGFQGFAGIVRGGSAGPSWAAGVTWMKKSISGGSGVYYWVPRRKSWLHTFGETGFRRSLQL